MEHAGTDVSVRDGGEHVAIVELTNPPNNFFSYEMIDGVASALEQLDEDDTFRCVVLCAAGRHFCAGADFSRPSTTTTDQLYAAAVRLFRTRKPIVAVVQGAAIGGGLGLALSADFRVAAEEARFSANFAQLGFHQGFGLSVTLPRLVGQQHAARLLYTGERVDGRRAVDLGLADEVEAATLHEAAEQARLQRTADFAEGVAAVAARRPATFQRR